MPHSLSAIIPAAGLSRRMGLCKQLLPLGDRAAILHGLEAVMAADCREIIVVTGPAGDRVEAAIRHLPVTIVRNPDRAADMAGSVRVGLDALTETVDGVMICPADHPLVAAETYRLLHRQHNAFPEEIIIPVWGGRRGHPTLFPLRLLREIRNGGTLRDIIHANPRQVRLVDVSDPGVVRDMDTPEDYRKMQRLLLERTTRH